MVGLKRALALANEQRLNWAKLFLGKDDKGSWNEVEINQQQVVLNADKQLSDFDWVKKNLPNFKADIEKLVFNSKISDADKTPILNSIVHSLRKNLTE